MTKVCHLCGTKLFCCHFKGYKTWTCGRMWIHAPITREMRAEWRRIGEAS